ncbi:hypothetical protein AOA59_07595 [Pseudomonas sp. 2822-15]|uniref:hypothetical protein n=1 Tax=unclassified Pseudomonas TaxID=196821 RepID=UPI000812B772|nr:MULTISPECIES: hypothetical protein [unclassified Pseudomonas]PIB45622.1 hypothetical protein AOA59_07595 [Pseudomonas sp. 2822-15]CRM44845.1 hypothetical protein [Pseudomonas sp. 58 R 3]
MRYLYLPVFAVFGLLAACDSGKPAGVVANDFCSFDSPVTATTLQTTEPFEPWGWAYNVKAGSIPKDVSIEIVSASNDVAASAPLTRSARPDVAKAFSKPELEMSGFVGKVDVSGLASGTYTVKIIQQEGTTRYVCSSPVKLKFHSAKG